SDSVNLGTDKISIWGYLKRFLFEDERINTKVKYLSGGEKARLLLAIVLKQGGNFLILDEPTNDLDLPTLRVLEEALVHYSAPVIVVSHDRYFLNRVATESSHLTEKRALPFRRGITIISFSNKLRSWRQKFRKFNRAKRKRPLFLLLKNSRRNSLTRNRKSWTAWKKLSLKLRN
ncbi:MAG: ABC-F family ATP-binding cassette domain-containing protein, partial [Lentisphaeria bacterium]|nr:ABC-F family ATP-binding cassette domain-containing protein [Lentisphaeria bacterium]